MNTRLTLACCAGLLCPVLLCPAECPADEIQVTDDWSIEITPGMRVERSSADAAAVGDDSVKQVSVNPANYERIYQTIPFNRAEYNGNPTYRHDSTMEILTGNPRHQTIVRHNNRPRRDYTSHPHPVVPYRYNNSRWGLNYFFYFPAWNYRGLY
jgi:hypothetical protein